MQLAKIIRECSGDPAWSPAGIALQPLMQSYLPTDNSKIETNVPFFPAFSAKLAV